MTQCFYSLISSLYTRLYFVRLLLLLLALCGQLKVYILFGSGLLHTCAESSHFLDCLANSLSSVLLTPFKLG